MNWINNQPVKIIFGSDTTKNLGEILIKNGYNNAFLVSDPIFKENGLIDLLISNSNGIIKNYFCDLTPNPSVEEVDNCAQLIRENSYDVIVALGGGSSLDCAKAACIVACDKYKTCEYHSGGRKFVKEALPIVAIPTTAGTGSEVTCVSVLTDRDKNLKAPIVSESFYPKLAIIDPVLTLTVPKKILAATGLDVLSHALEGYWSKNHQPICDALGIYAADLIFKNLRKSFQNPSDICAREKLCEASVIAGLAFTIPKTAGVHACSFPLTTEYGLSHGEACAFTLDSFTKINAEVENGRLHELAKKCGFKDAYDMANEITSLKKDLGMKLSLADANILENDIASLAKLSQHPNMNNNPITMTQDMLIDMYKSIG